MKMYARKEVRKKRELSADIIDMYWNKGMLQTEIAATLEQSLGSIAKIVGNYWDSKTPTEKDQLLTKRSKMRGIKLEGKIHG